MDLSRELTIEEVKLRFNYDPETGVITRLIWHGTHAPGSVFKVTGQGSTIILNYRNYGIRRFVWFYMTEEWPEYHAVIEPKDGDWTNLKWNNLRLGSRRKRY